MLRENPATVYLMDDDAQRREQVHVAASQLALDFLPILDASQLASCSASARPGCLILSDTILAEAERLNGHPVTDFQSFSSGGRLNLVGRGLTTIVICQHPDVQNIVRYMRAGALNVLPTPLETETLIHWISEAITIDRSRAGQEGRLEQIRNVYSELTERKRCVLQHMIDGRASKWSAHVLDVSRRTIELDRAEILHAFSVNNAIELARLMTETKCLPLNYSFMPVFESPSMSMAK